MRLSMMFVVVLLTMLPRRARATHTEDPRVKVLIHDWAPLVWLAPGERFLPLGVPEFLDNMQADEEDDNYLRTRLNLPHFDNLVRRKGEGSRGLERRMLAESLLQNESSFLHGRKPSGNVPIYALVKNCLSAPSAAAATSPSPITKLMDNAKTEATNSRPHALPANLLLDEFVVKPIESNAVTGSNENQNDYSKEKQQLQTRKSRAYPTQEQPTQQSLISTKRQALLKSYTRANDRSSSSSSKSIGRRRAKKQAPLHFHVTYWMFYPFSEGKAVCVLDLGFLGTWPIPSLAGVCLGRLKEYGSHVGDWEHVSLYFKGKNQPAAMYVSAHDAGAFYRYEPRSGTFVFESQETRKGIFQKPIFPERVYTSDGSHPILFSARGSHGLWTAPGKHKFVRLPRLYDESGFGTAWPTWKKVEMLSIQNKSEMPSWMTFTGRWGNPKSNCHPLAKLGFNICEFVDGPTGIPMKKLNFRC